MATTSIAELDGVERNAPWIAAQRAEEWAGELRVNLIRLVALSVFYAYHLFNFYVRQLPEITPQYHYIVSGITIAWAASAVVLHRSLVRRVNPPYVKYAAVGWDVFMATSLLIFSDGPRSPFLPLLLLIIATAPLRIHLRLVWVASLLSLLSYGVVCGHSKWIQPDGRVPIQHHVIFALSLGVAGLLAGQSVRQARRFAPEYADRIKFATGLASTEDIPDED